MRELIRIVESAGRVGYHVTSREAAESILRDGFWGGAGDVGLGVYFWKSLGKARSYAASGGWDGTLKDPVIIEVRDPALREIDADLLHPSWNAATYEQMLWVPFEDEDGEPVDFGDGPDANWRPQQMQAVA